MWATSAFLDSKLLPGNKQTPGSEVYKHTDTSSPQFLFWLNKQGIRKVELVTIQQSQATC